MHRSRMGEWIKYLTSNQWNCDWLLYEFGKWKYSNKYKYYFFYPNGEKPTVKVSLSLLQQTLKCTWLLKWFWQKRNTIKKKKKKKQNKKSKSIKNTPKLPKMISKRIPVLSCNLFFLSGFSFTNIHESQDCRGRERAFH